MTAAEVKIGRYYAAKVSGKMTIVKDRGRIISRRMGRQKHLHQSPSPHPISSETAGRRNGKRQANRTGYEGTGALMDYFAYGSNIRIIHLFSGKRRSLHWRALIGTLPASVRNN